MGSKRYNNDLLGKTLFLLVCIHFEPESHTDRKENGAEYTDCFGKFIVHKRNA